MTNKDIKAITISEDSRHFKKIKNSFIKKIKKEIRKLKKNEREKLLNNLIQKIEAKLRQENIQIITTKKRIKEDLSLIDKIIRKIHKLIPINPEKNVNDLIEEITIEKIKENIFDLIGIRIVLKNQKDCYEVVKILSDIKEIKFVKKESTDYIKSPKENGYQAFHFIGQDKKTGRFFEVQIMTENMLEKADIGEAAREKYKEKKGDRFFKSMAMLAAAAGRIYYSVRNKRKKK